MPSTLCASRRNEFHAALQLQSQRIDEAHVVLHTWWSFCAEVVSTRHGSYSTSCARGISSWPRCVVACWTGVARWPSDACQARALPRSDISTSTSGVNKLDNARMPLRNPPPPRLSLDATSAVWRLRGFLIVCTPTNISRAGSHGAVAAGAVGCAHRDPSRHLAVGGFLLAHVVVG